MNSTLYTGRLMHRRHGVYAYLFHYRIFSLYLDVDEIPALVRRLRLFSHNRFNLFSFHDRDFGAGDTGSLRAWAEEMVRAEGVDLEGGKIYLLCYPRVLGYTFNPLSVWYCYDREHRLRAAICEVHNTFGEKHHYLLTAPQNGPEVCTRTYHSPKCFHVSPFIQPQAEYCFRLSQPGRTVRIAIRVSTEGAPLLDAALYAKRHVLDDRRLLALFFRIPLFTLQVIALIHWNALKLWVRRAPLYHKPPPPLDPATRAWSGPET